MKRGIFTLIVMFTISFALSACSDRAEPIILPDLEEVISVKVSEDDDELVYTDVEDISSIISKINEAKATSKPTVQDNPVNVDNYYSVYITANEEQSTTLYIYKEKSKWYIEQPYQGIYETDEAIFEHLGGGVLNE